MTPRCYSLSSNGGKGSRWGGSSLQVLVSMAAWFCSARKQGLWCRHPLRSLGVGAAGCQPCSAVPCRGLCASLLALLHVGDGVQRVQLLPAVLIPVCCSGGWCRNTELHRPSFRIVAPHRAPRPCLGRQKQSPCSTISLHCRPRGPKAAPAPCQAALDSHRCVFIVGPVNRRASVPPLLCRQMHTVLQMAAALL